MEKEIQELARKLEEKKKELAEKPGEAPPEKEVLREVLKQQVEEERKSQPGEGFSLSPSPPPLHTVQPSADEAQKKEEREKQIKQLVEIALTKGIKNAVSVARRTTPYLLDELHDHLVDDYYEKLITLGKIKKI